MSDVKVLIKSTGDIDVVHVENGVVPGYELQNDDILVPLGLYNNFVKPHWDGTQWEEGATQDETDALNPTPSIIQQLTATDAGMARVAEDIVDLLVAEGKVFPQSVLDKIAERKALRSSL